jgi:hypothetical protein
MHIFALVAALVAACATSFAATAHKTGWLQDYHRLNHIGGVPLEQVWVQPEFDVRAYRVLYIAPVQIDPCANRRGGEKDHQAAQRLADAFRRQLEQRLREAAIFEVVSTDPYFSTARSQSLTLQVRITEFYSGNPGARALIGFGAGATEVQVEGKVLECKSGRTLSEFADRRLHPGGTLLLGPKATKDSEYLIGIDMKGILDGVAKLFVYLREEGPQNQQMY